MAQSDTNAQQSEIDRVDRLARRLFVAGSVAFIVIGLAHTATQFTTLSSDEVQLAYRAGGPIEVNGEVVDGWDLFAGTSVLMGFYGIALGALNLATLPWRSRRGDGRGLPSAAACIITMAMLLVIALVGATYLGPLQLIGGLVGQVLFGVPLWRTWRARVQRRWPQPEMLGA